MLSECSLLHHCNEIIVHLDHGRAGGEGGRKERKVMERREMNGKGEAREREGGRERNKKGKEEGEKGEMEKERENGERGGRRGEKGKGKARKTSPCTTSAIFCVHL